MESVRKFVYDYGHFPEQMYGLYLIEDLCDTIYYTIIMLEIQM